MTTSNRNYRGWTHIEDQKLIDALVNMVNKGGYKAENGFKAGYLQHLEACLKEALPDSGLLAKPHIDSRIRTLKKDWQSFYDMLNTSGFGYDKERNCVTTSDPEILKAYFESHKHAHKWKDKGPPHYEEMCAIFGKDRAKGDRAKSVVQMEQEANMEEQEHQGDKDDELGEHSHNEGTNASFQVETSSGRSKKRKRTNQVNTLFQSFNDAVVQFGDRLKETSAELSEDIKFELDVKKKTLIIPSELSKMSSLSQLDRFRAIDIIKDDHNRVMTFWTLGEDEREAWVRYMLSKFG